MEVTDNNNLSGYNYTKLIMVVKSFVVQASGLFYKVFNVYSCRSNIIRWVLHAGLFTLGCPCWSVHGGLPMLVCPSWFVHAGLPKLVCPCWFDHAGCPCWLSMLVCPCWFVYDGLTMQGSPCFAVHNGIGLAMLNGSCSALSVLGCP
jgi:hypothetical protein